MKERNLHIVLSYTEPNSFFLKEEFEETKYFKKVIIHSRKSKSGILKDLRFFEMILLAFKAIPKTKKNDIIIGWSYYQGIALYLVSILLFRKRLIIANNLILDEYGTGFLYKIREFLHKFPLLSAKFIPTVNAEGLKEMYSQKFKYSKNRFKKVNDSYDQYFEISESYNPGDGFIFSGGTANRDLECLINVAKSCPDTKFIGCFLKQQVDNILSLGKPDNLILYHDLPISEFYDLLKQSSAVMIPLKDNRASGLIVVYRSILLRKPIITTETHSMKEVIPDEQCGFLCKIGDYKHMSKCVKEILSKEDLCLSMTNKAFNHMKQYNSTRCVKQFMDIILGL